MAPNRKAAVTLLIALVALPALTTLTTLAAAPAGAQDMVAGRNQVRLSVLAHHPYPDKPLDQGGDPFGIPATNATGAPKDWMASHYDAYWFPTARFDGVLESANQPDAAPRSFLDAYRTRHSERMAEDAPAAIRVTGAINDTTARVRVTVMPLATVDAHVTLRLAVYEDDVPFDGDNGVTNHRFVVRAMLPPEPIPLQRGEVVTAEHAFLLGRGLDGAPWPGDRLGAVAYLQVGDAGGGLQAGEVLQSATYRFSQAAPTVQADKAVLLEMYTATWCDACVQGDGAMDLLAEEHGVASAIVSHSGWRYFQAPSLAAAALALLTAAGLVVALTPRSREDDP